VIKHHISHRIIKRIKACWKSTNEVYIEKDKGKRDFKLSKLHYNMLLTYFEDRPQAYLDEIAWFLYDNYNLEVNENII